MDENQKDDDQMWTEQQLLDYLRENDEEREILMSFVKIKHGFKENKQRFDNLEINKID